MSWAEDNNIDCWSEDDISVEKNWNDGIHITKDGEEIKISEMTESHLKNTIKYFSRVADVSILEKELANRKLRD